MEVRNAAPRAEYASLTQYLRDSLSESERSRIGLVGFTQWPFTLGAMSEIALAGHALGSTLAIGFWADRTPLPDIGWTTSRAASRIMRSRTIEEAAQAGLMAAGVPAESFAAPPIRHWRPREHMPTLPSPLNRSAIRGLTYADSPMGRAILQVHPNFNTPIRDDYVWPRRWIKAATRSYAWVYDQTMRLIRDRDLTALAVFNGRFTHDNAAAAAAHAAGIRVLNYDNGGIETEFDFSIDATHDWHALQRRMLTMWDRWPDDDGPESRAAVARTWFDGRQSHSEPSIQPFVESQRKGYLDGLPTADLVVTYFSSSPDEIAELDLDWSEYLNSQEEALTRLAEACREHDGARLIVRTHPHMRMKPSDDLRDWRTAVEAARPDVHFDADSPIDSYELMQASDIVFTYGSTAGVEAARLGKSVVVMGPSAYDILGCAHRITNAEAIPALLASPPPPRPEAALPYGLMMQRRGFGYEFLSGSARTTAVIAGVPMSDAKPSARKISHVMKDLRYRWLTAR